jgi:RNA polymerase sigma-70 factor (ECF subfamily)
MADALTGLYRQLQGRALFLTQNREAANELVQGVCERALRKQSMFAPGTNLEAWLRRVMRNLFIDELRRRHLCVPMPCVPQTQAPEDELTCPLDLLGWEDVLAGIEGMDATDRTVLELAYIRGVAYRDIATRLELNPRTVNTRVFRAKARLRQRLQAVLAQRQSAAA